VGTSGNTASGALVGTPGAAAQGRGWTAGRITALASGSVLVLVALCLLGAGGAGLWADLTQRDGGYATTGVRHFSTAGSALATEHTDLGTSGLGWLYSPDVLGQVRVRVTPSDSSPPLFVGIGPSDAVDRYLAGVRRTVISDFRSEKTATVDGGKPPSAPATQGFWVASSSGTGARSVVWKPSDGSWTVVVMAADGRAGIDVGADLGAKVPALLWVALGVLMAGAVFLAGGGLLIASAVRSRAPPSDGQGGVMSTPNIAVAAPRELARATDEVDRYEAVKQYSLAKIIGVWAAAALPMAILAWVVAPTLADHLSGTGDVPMFKALNLILTIGLAWQFLLVAGLVWQEQRTFRWSSVRETLWLRSPRSPKTGKLGGKLWLIVIPLIVLTFIESLLPALGAPADRDLGKFLDSDVGKQFLQGAWGWYALMLLWFVLNTVLGEELLFRGVLLPRMKRVFGRGDWAGNGVLFALYHLHVPWMILPTLAIDTFAIAYPSRRYQSALIGIVVHSAQSVFLAVILLTLVM
jgi:membrane protease YdiL (CAAX protease family)